MFQPNRNTKYDATRQASSHLYRLTIRGHRSNGGALHCTTIPVCSRSMVLHALLLLGLLHTVRISGQLSSPRCALLLVHTCHTRMRLASGRRRRAPPVWVSHTHSRVPYRSLRTAPSNTAVQGPSLQVCVRGSPRINTPPKLMSTADSGTLPSFFVSHSPFLLYLLRSLFLSMPFLDREHFTPHFLSVKRQGTVTGAVAALLGTLLGEFCYYINRNVSLARPFLYSYDVQYCTAGAR